jgi:HD superfamily phosphohydrolase
MLPTVYPPNLKYLAQVLQERYDFLGEIRKGSTAATYALRSKASGQNVCLKTALPTDSDFKQIRRKLERELQYLSPPLGHRCLPQVFDCQLAEGVQPYVVLTYHPGQTFAEHCTAKTRFTFDDAVYILQHLTDVLKHLHENHICHRDLHANNILVASDVLRHGILLIDYGNSIRAGSPQLHFTSDFGPTSLEPEKFIWEEGRLRDFEHLGSLLYQMRLPLVGLAPRDNRIEYERLVTELLQRRAKDWDYVGKLVKAVINPHHAINAAKHVFFSGELGSTYISVPVLKAVSVSESLLHVVETSQFQRLKRIPQLSFCSDCFPGALHNRFEHSLGVFSHSRTALTHLCDSAAFRRTIDETDVKAFLMAALLHDVGHYPYAHVVEQYVGARFSDDEQLRNLVSHAELSQTMIQGDQCELARIVESCIGATAKQKCVRILRAKVPHLSPLIDGPIDCDKLDYLSRDALHCGVPFGSGLDADALMRAYRLSNSGGIAVSEEGLPAAEGLVILQHQMLKGVYWHEQVRARFAMFQEFVKAVVADGKPEVERVAVESLVRALQNCNSEAEALVGVFPELAFNKNVSSLICPLLCIENEFTKPVAYSCIATYWPHQTTVVSAAGSSLHEAVFRGRNHTTAPINWRALQVVRGIWASVLKRNGCEDIQFEEVLVDMPFGKTTHLPFDVKFSDSTELSVTQLSHLHKTAFEHPAIHCSPVRVFVARRIYGAIRCDWDSLRSEFALTYRSPSFQKMDDSLLLEGGAH